MNLFGQKIVAYTVEYNFFGVLKTVIVEAYNEYDARSLFKKHYPYHPIVSIDTPCSIAEKLADKIISKILENMKSKLSIK